MNKKVNLSVDYLLVIYIHICIIYDYLNREREQCRLNQLDQT